MWYSKIRKLKANKRMIRKVIGNKLRFAVVIVAVVAVTLLVVQYASSSSPSSVLQENSVPQQTDKLSNLEPTTNTETAQLELDTSTQADTAETVPTQPLPEPTDSSYESACQKAKDDYTAEYDAAIQVENTKHRSNQQIIMNKYSKEGMSFSSVQKNVQAKETQRHNSELKALEIKHDAKVSSLEC